MNDFLKNNIKTISLYIVCWSFGLLFVFKSTPYISFEDPESNHFFTIGALLFGVSLILIPFFKKLKIGKLVELEREISNTKDELNEFKTEVRNNLSVLSTNINTIGNLSNQITINLPGKDEINKEINNISLHKSGIKEDAEKVKSQFNLDEKDNVLSIVKIRIQLEALLKDILADEIKENAFKPYSLTYLINAFFEKYPDYDYLKNSFDYVRRLGNAAVHSQKFDLDQLDNAIDLGSVLIAVLERISSKIE